MEITLKIYRQIKENVNIQTNVVENLVLGGSFTTSEEE